VWALDVVSGDLQGGHRHHPGLLPCHTYIILLYCMYLCIHM
jgi:hypothetical protein